MKAHRSSLGMSALLASLLIVSGCNAPSGIGGILDIITGYISERCDDASEESFERCDLIASALEYIKLNEGAIIERLTVAANSGAFAELLGGAAEYVESNGGLTDIWSGMIGAEGFTGDSLIADNDARVYFDKKLGKSSVDVNGNIVAKGGSRIYIAAGEFDVGASISSIDTSTVSLYGSFDLSACGISDAYGVVDADTNGTGSCQVTGTLASGDAIDVVVQATDSGTIYFFDISDFYHESLDD